MTDEEFATKYAQAPLHARDLPTIIGAITTGVKNVLGIRDSRITALEARIAQLEARPELKYFGTHEPGKLYFRGSAVTHKGNIWIALSDTASAPMEQVTEKQWQLACRAGRDGRDGKDAPSQRR